MLCISTSLRYPSRWLRYRIRIRSARRAARSPSPPPQSSSSLSLHSEGTQADALPNLEVTRVHVWRNRAVTKVPGSPSLEGISKAVEAPP